MSWRCAGAIVLGGVVACAAAHGDVVHLAPVADDFVTSSAPASVYGSAGALAVAAPGSVRGEFQSFIRFDTTSAVAGFDAAFGTGQWHVESVTLTLSPTTPQNDIFNASAAGSIAIRWLENDGWAEGTGNPTTPGTSGISFNTIPAFVSAADEALGTFGVTTDVFHADAFALNLTPGFTADVSAGGLVSLRLLAADDAVAYIVNSRNYPDAATRPDLAIVAVANPVNHACNPADIVSVGQQPPPDGLLTGDDYVAFINAFFTGNPLADIVSVGQQPPPDGLLTGDDYVAFINSFFVGCR